ncbi:MAG: hypothetical protein ACYDGS_03215 [Thermoleophilia bacterium]
MAAVNVQTKDETGLRPVAQEEFDTYSGGVFGETWDLWTKEGKSLISRDGYIRLHAECKTIQGIPFEILKISINGDRATVMGKRAGFDFAFEFAYEDGEWRFDPPADDKADYKLGIDALIAKMKAEGRCAQGGSA